MILEFLQDSPELQKFASDLRFHSTVGELDDYSSTCVYRHLDGRYFAVEIGYKGKFVAYRKDWKHENPYVVKFTEVTPKEEVVTLIKWVDIENGERL